ncbi:hypothetical protein VT84_03285 [Gemmata sp. SH-PL17]|uniref:hypothetical protein n=1 Tax=Gemmata sp. SH-PL17 TaxID=1630693 RepID=UPI00078C016D|nr:hypothetical protein [Gemmata sp. SH-PL17]AMV23406.1 hypothetical protein VT84_03285 [Gemmata sp. SH-PL17]
MKAVLVYGVAPGVVAVVYASILVFDFDWRIRLLSTVFLIFSTIAYFSYSYFTNYDRRARRHAAFFFFFSGSGLALRAASGFALDLGLVTSPEKIPFLPELRTSVKLETSWISDIFLITLSYLMFRFGHNILMSIPICTDTTEEGAVNTRPNSQVNATDWDRFCTIRGYLLYVINLVDTGEQKRTQEMREMLIEVLVNDNRQYAEHFELDELRAKQLLFQALKEFRSHHKHLFEVHGKMLPNLQKVDRRLATWTKTHK